MNSTTTKRFRDLLARLPTPVQHQAQDAYRLFRDNPSHPSLRFKQIGTGDQAVCSVRVSRQYRALGVLHGDTIVWMWIGSHSDYDREIGRQ